jgi:hypothetical protein
MRTTTKKKKQLPQEYKEDKDKRIRGDIIST